MAMNKSFLACPLLLAGIAVQAQMVNIRGKVSNPAGQAISGATVELAVRKLKDTTGSDGTYSLAGTTGIGRQALPELMALHGSILELVLSRSQPVKLEVFDVRGNLLKREVQANASAGAYRWNLSENASPDDMSVVKASVGGQVRTFHYLPLVGAGYAARSPAYADAPMAARLAKAAAALDTLTISASGFTTMKVPLSGYDTTVNVTLAVSGGGGYPLKNEPVKSAGCGKATTLGTGTSSRTISSSGDNRQYMLTMPPNYDMNKPYRFIYASHGQGGKGSDISGDYYDIKEIAEAAGSTIFVAASGIGGIWGLKDVPLFEDILKFVKQGACLDESRVFVTGFSFGGMYSYSLSVTSQKLIRAGLGMGPANYNIQIPSTRNNAPIAWLQTTGMSDGTTPWVNNEAQKRGAKFIAIEMASNNGCTIPAEIPTWKSGSPICYEFQGCKSGYPVTACTFNGGHTIMPGASAKLWQFITQF